MDWRGCSCCGGRCSDNFDSARRSWRTAASALVFRQVLEDLFVERMELNEERFTDYMSKPDMQDLVSTWLADKVFDRVWTGAAPS
jgi:hypothetical protein